MNLHIKRIIAYIIQVIVIIIIYSMLSFIAIMIFKFFINATAPNILDFFKLDNLYFNVDKDVLLSMYQKLEPSTFIEMYKELIIMLVAYCVLLFIVVPFVTRNIVFILGDIGKSVTKIYVVSRGRVVSGKLSVKGSPAFKTFTLYYVIILFFQLSLPMFDLLSDIETSKSLTILINLIFIGILVEFLYSIGIMFRYLIGFIMKNYFWRTKVETEVVDDLKLYEERYNQEVEINKKEKLIQKKKEEVERARMRELEIRTRDSTNSNNPKAVNNYQNQQSNAYISSIHCQQEQEIIYFPIFYNLMLNNGYTLEQYKLLEIKSRNNKELAKILKFMEMNQKKNPDYMAQNIKQIREILDIAK